jgi:hypothetical protein
MLLKDTARYDRSIFVLIAFFLKNFKTLPEVLFYLLSYHLAPTIGPVCIFEYCQSPKLKQ